MVMRDFEKEYGAFVKDNTPEFWDKIQSKIAFMPVSDTEKKVIDMGDYKKKRNKNHRFSSKWWSIGLVAACLALVISGGWRIFGSYVQGSRGSVSLIGDGSSDVVDDEEYGFDGAFIGSGSSDSVSSSGSDWSTGNSLSGLGSGSSDSGSFFGDGFSFDMFSRGKEESTTTKKEPVVDTEPLISEPESVASESDVVESKPSTVYDNYWDAYEDDNEPSANVLTAGEWNDNDNWRFFESIVNDGLVDFPSFGLDPRYRIKVHVTDGNGKSVAGVEVTLRGNSIYHSNYEDDGLMPNRGQGYDTIWTSVTNKNGIAYLFAEKPDATELFVDVRNADNYFDIYPVTMCDNVINSSPNYKSSGNNVPDPFSSINSSSIFNDIEATTNLDSSKLNTLQVMFIIDTTGSMSDEIDFLKKDFSAIAKDVDPGQSYVEYGVVLYRDDGDEYVTKSFDFTRNISSVQNYINSIEANGGGDAPEAVDKALFVAFSDELSWDYNSNKVAFLIFDAPPHDNIDHMMINYIIGEISGFVHVVPVLASTSDRDAEMFGRALGIMTDGSYVFLTDDSGVGNSHMKPIIGQYNVELLHDVIVRIIKSYQ